MTRSPPISAVRESPRDRGVPLSVAAAVARALSELGEQPVDLGPWGAAGVVPGSTVDAWLDARAARLDDAALGIRIATAIPVGGFGLFDYAFCASPVLREALRRLCRYYCLVRERGSLALVEDGTRGSLIFRDRATNAQDRYWIELVMAIVVSRMRHTLGERATLEEVRLAHSAPPSASSHEEFFRVPVLFGQPRNEIVFPSSLFAAPLRTAAPALAELLDGKLADLEPALTGDAFLDDVRRVLRIMVDERALGVVVAAARLSMSVRTLQRELQRRRVSHSALLDEVRCARAIELLDAGVAATTAAEQLGFSEPGAFFRAFRRWTGRSPGNFRRERRRATSCAV